MKKIILSALAASVAASASAFDPKDLLGNLGKLNGDTTTTTGDSQSTGGVLGSLGSLIGNVVANNKFSIDDLVAHGHIHRLLLVFRARTR